MSRNDSSTHVESDRFRATASAIRALIRVAKDPDVRNELTMLVAQYEKLARYAESLELLSLTKPN